MIPPSFSALAAPAINHLLADEPWARERLARHAGKVAAIDASPLAVRLKVSADGAVEADERKTDEPASVVIRARFADLPLMMQDRDRAFSYATIEGDAEFANAISQVARALRWDAEGDLARWVGDIAARRIVSGARVSAGAAQSAGRRLAENAAEYFLEENPMLASPHAVAGFAADVVRLRDDVERLAKRIEKLTQK